MFICLCLVARVTCFEYTPELIVFDLLEVPLYHGWLIDTALPRHVDAVGNMTYNQLVELIIQDQASENVDKQTRGEMNIVRRR